MAKPAAEKPPKPDVESDSDSSDDEDYVPDDKGDIQSEGEDDADDSDTEQHTHDTEAGEEYTTTRSGKRRINGSPFDESDASKKHRVDSELVNQAEALNKKDRLDALWKELNTPISKPTSRPELLAAASTGSSGSGGSGTSQSESAKMVTITTTYDFAGETVTVTKDVPENSKEARDAAQKNKTGNDNNNTLSTSASTASPSTSISSSTSAPSSEIGPVRYVRKKSTLDELAATYGVKKPPKLNTLEKSKLDWNNFVGKEGIEDELKHHNKDGYMEKVAFLQRTDERRDIEYQMLKKKK
ncbi:craniofacial development protein 1-like protein [Dissophora ornata]|nr:craniofacial development protein 1-like protein [Dissophora ornata]